ncbi:probable metabolite transport protein CsbC, partial [Adelges cooleyi]|uniref:probable metabolite transport protein CsbC n=1 Tax=Adelges cooleyi TaxID=133065 RepID=UPI00217F7828
FKDPILVLIGLVCLHKFSGIYYQRIQLQIIGNMYDWDPSATVGFINMVEISMAIVCTCLVNYMEKKYLLVISGFGMAVMLALMNITYITYGLLPTENTLLPTFTFIYIIFYSIGYGPLLWVIMPEICPRQTRLWTSGFTVSLYALLSLIIDQPFYNFIIVMYYDVNFVLLYFTIVCTTGAVLTHIYMPETKDYKY